MLSQIAAEVPKGTDCTELIADMFEAMYNAKGMGLAAPQIGESLRIIVGEHERAGWRFVLINPTIKKVTGKERADEEGCLSVPGSSKDRIRVKRYKHIEVRGFDENWEQVTVSGRSWLARCLQHEIDHLNGLTIARFT